MAGKMTGTKGGAEKDFRDAAAYVVTLWRELEGDGT
jgi:hypothetical protein